MSANSSAEEIFDLFDNAKCVVMSLHSSPDGDSLGACVAMKHYFKGKNLAVKVVSHDLLSENLAESAFAEEVEFGPSIEQAIEEALATHKQGHIVVLALDTASLEMIGKRDSDRSLGDLKKSERVRVVNIDHHLTNTFYGDLNYVDVEEPACCGVLLSLLRARGERISAEMASALLLGICTDSGFFSYWPHAEKALKEGAFLLEMGAEYYDKIVRVVRNSIPLKLAKFNALLINNLRVNEEKRFAYSTCAFEEVKTLGLNDAEVRLGVNALVGIKGFEFVFTLTEIARGKVKGSFRSQEKVDVSLFAKALGGGGHKTAAGFILENASLEEAEKKVLEVIGENYSHAREE
ncbi:hypothetical protein D6817_02020 [Candidatus Pacearchaeota archaeon]|nr:MAG: hypothetical protein D6817_02020 [Candidatus Pacearchaeota archaeon]